MGDSAVVFGLKDIVDALEGTSDDGRYLANVETGEIIYYSEFLGLDGYDDLDEDDLEGDEWIALPDKFDIDSWRFMRDFAWALGGSEGEELLDAVHGKGAFRNFRRCVERMGALDSWYAYQNKRYQELAVEWLEDNKLAWKDDLPEQWKRDWRELLPAALREKLTLEVLEPAFSVCKLASTDGLVDMLAGGTCFIAKTADEVSLVCETDAIPAQALGRAAGNEAGAVPARAHEGEGGAGPEHAIASEVDAGSACAPEGEADAASIHASGQGAPAVSIRLLEREDGWRALKVAGPLDFALVGILAKIAAALAQAEIPLFAVSTFDTDYILVKADNLDRAIDALRAAGCEVG